MTLFRKFVWMTLMKKLRSKRRKRRVAADLALPPINVITRRDPLNLQEKEHYDSLVEKLRSQFESFQLSGSIFTNACIFGFLPQFQQVVNHPYCEEYSEANSNGGEYACGVCYDPAEDPVVASCGHFFCTVCFNDYSAAFVGKVSCPKCLETLVGFEEKIDRVPSSMLFKINLQAFQTSSKIEALKEEIIFMIERDDSAKGVVFSQFTSFLDLIEHSLKMFGVHCVKIAGNLTMPERDAAMKKFTDEPDCKILLMSLKVRGVEIDLTAASHAFMMDPWWNPAVKPLVQDRIHRIGQKKEVRIVRFIMKDTIDEAIVVTQQTHLNMLSRTPFEVDWTVSSLPQTQLKLNMYDTMCLLERIGIK